MRKILKKPHKKKKGNVYKMILSAVFISHLGKTQKKHKEIKKNTHNIKKYRGTCVVMLRMSINWTYS